ncbi:BamA/TamA family outer membrane protein [Hymenobacter sp. BT664]|uniref:BamA/TamA family outer membrane protein n=1 Tax=Hymenobacter montanus TaxID=2771359 RepID=A0A927GI83_9BACT|nr:BamA/TamA family outer membrane protein [Hymenobacter montanus]MBD2767127.1 BamA/TamA family outer membrane protein [Hymenobacter montanus]
MLPCLLFSACSGLRYIPANEKLYTGSKVKINYPEKPRNAAALQSELEGVIRPKPNASFLGLRPKLYFWHLGVGKTKGLGKFLADKLGEPPVLLSQVKIAATRGLMTNRLQNRGYFHAAVTHEVKSDEKTAQVNYTATTGTVYKIKEVNFPAGDSAVLVAIRGTQAGSLLKVGDPYNLDVLTQERVRIDASLKNQGFYYFTPDILLFAVDSTLHNQVTVDVQVKAAAPARALRPYWLNNVKLNTNFVLTDTIRRQPILFQKYQYFPDERMFRARAITKAVFLTPDSLFRQRRRDQTLSRLMSLGTFRFVEIRFNPAAAGDSAGRARLDADVRMTQLKKKSLRAELQLVNKTNDFTGPGLNVSFRNRSALRGAEQLIITGTAAYEIQTRAPANNESRSNSGAISTDFGINAQLIVPRLISPNLPLLDVKLPNSDFQPRTTFGAGVRYVTRTGYFSTANFSLNYGYSWKTKITNEQELRPIDVTYSAFSSEPAFDEVLAAKQFLRTAFQQQFILGSSYRYTYNQQLLEQRRQQIFFQGRLEFSGNVANALNGLSTKREGSEYYTIAGQRFAQYSKLDLELREYYRISPNPNSGNRIVGRLQVGIGLPYGNSAGGTLPYLRQYGIGGPNSVRAYAAREVGPGIYHPSGSSINNYYDQVGDLRLEGNVEYRQDLFPYVKGAVFMDAGNIWLVNEDPSRPGGKFNSSTFLKQLAVGAGAGIRIDVQFFVIRFDYAIPLRAPYGTPESTTGRLNLAIGYPF